jgi:small subunit ribosomal protein S17
MSKQTITGVVTSVKNQKSITITVHETKTHPLYKKRYSVTKKYSAHDEKSEAKLGDQVIVEACKPLSATKFFTLKTIVRKATEADVVQVKEDVTSPEVLRHTREVTV